jgi:ATP-binding cassette, subfamily F, member 2
MAGGKSKKGKGRGNSAFDSDGEDDNKYDLMAAAAANANEEHVADGEDEAVKPISKAKKNKNAKKAKKEVKVDADGRDDAEDLNESIEQLSLEGQKKAKNDRKRKGKVADDDKGADDPPTPTKPSSATATDGGSGGMFMDADEAGRPLSAGEFINKKEHLTATGILLSNQRSKDIQLDKFSLSAYGNHLVRDTSLNLLYGRRYGLVGANGCGKSTLLRALAHREVPIQDTVSLYFLEGEYDANPNITATEAVLLIVKEERERLEEEQDELIINSDGNPQSARWDYIQERLRELDLKSAEQKARGILYGLGFTGEMQDMRTSEFSGGWRMRVSLARALFVRPTCLLLDDATNHLDLSAVVWLEDYLATEYPHTIVLVSHSQDFLNTVCTDILYLDIATKQLSAFSGNYDTFVKVKSELDENLRKRAKADEKKMQKLKDNMGKTGKQAKQAKSAEKAMLKRKEKEAREGGIEELQVVEAPTFIKPHEFDFMQCGGGLPSPFLKFNDVSFSYPGRPFLYKNLNFGVDLKSRIALVVRIDITILLLTLPFTCSVDTYSILGYLGAKWRRKEYIDEVDDWRAQPYCRYG